MRPVSPPSMQVVRQEAKQGKLVTFISAALDRAPGAVAIDVLARSSSSPVVRALDEVMAAAPRAGVTVRLALADATTQSGLRAQVDRIELRRVVRQPLREAHELLVISGVACWIGDCMRRDPSNRDAFECHVEDCADMIERTARSFERLWALADGAPAAREDGPAPSGSLADPAPLAAISPPSDGQPTVGTRH